MSECKLDDCPYIKELAAVCNERDGLRKRAKDAEKALVEMTAERDGLKKKCDRLSDRVTEGCSLLKRLMAKIEASAPPS